MDLRTRKAAVNGHDLALTASEFDILECLALDPGRVVTRQELLEAAWDAHWYGPTKVPDVHVAALRRKLGVPGLIETVYGRGFRLGDSLRHSRWLRRARCARGSPYPRTSTRTGWSCGRSGRPGPAPRR